MWKEKEHLPKPDVSFLVPYTMQGIFRGLCGGSCLRHHATGREVTGSIPDGVAVIFHLHNLTEMISGNISWRVKAAGA
jgi:hypothetical protein